MQIGHKATKTIFTRLQLLDSDLKLQKDFMQDDIKSLGQEIHARELEKDSLANFSEFISTFPLSYEEFYYEDDDHMVKKRKEQTFNDYRKINKDSLLKDQSSVEQQIYELNSRIIQLRTDISDNDMLRNSIS